MAAVDAVAKIGAAILLLLLGAIVFETPKFWREFKNSDLLQPCKGSFFSQKDQNNTAK